MSIGSLMNIGQSALIASQASIAVTGNNIANVNTPGYSRQYVRLEDAYALEGRPGARGQGVNAVEVLRRFDKFLEKSYLDKSSTATRWSETYNALTSVENIFNEANRSGVSSGMVSFFNGWKDVSLRPNDTSTRQSMLSYADSLTLLMRQTMSNMEEIQRQMDEAIREDVSRANELMELIADLNRQITMHTQPGVSNPNNLLDKRDTAVRQLAEIIDVQVVDRGGGDYTVFTRSGKPLVEHSQHYELTVQGAQAESNKIVGSAYKGEINFVGTDSHEYTVEIVRGGDTTITDPNPPFGPIPNPTPPQFRVSLDGGRTWLKDENGQDILYDITDTDGDGKVDPVQVKNLTITFGTPDPLNPAWATDNFTIGDRFIITPKTGLYWVEPTRGPENITPQIYFDGTDNQQRVTGGSLAAYFNVRDDNIGRYQDEMNALAKALIWEVNRLHSQGVGLAPVGYFNGTESVFDAGATLGTAQSGLVYYDKLTAGNIQFNIYDKTTGDWINGGPLDFSFTGKPSPLAPSVNFDPNLHTLEDVRNAINTTYAGQLNASINNGKLSIETATGANAAFALGTDTTGLMAALGINTFFQGTTAADIAVNIDVHSNLNRICAGAVNGANEINPGDNSIANAIGDLLNKPVVISTIWRTAGNQSLTEFYSATVAVVGSDTRSAKTSLEYNGALAMDLDARIASLSGVNLDEEMASLIRFQHSYTAAAKLITTADQMLQTLLGLKQ